MERARPFCCMARMCTWRPQGEIVARKYRIVTINSTNLQVEDLVNHDTQVLPLITR